MNRPKQAAPTRSRRKLQNSKSSRYDLELMEPRLLLSGTPVNLYVNGDADSSAREAVKTQLNVLFTKIESIGQQVKGSAPLTNAQMDQKAVLVEKSLKELFGTQAGDPALDFRQLGDYLQGKNASQTSNQYLAALADTFAAGVNAPDSQLLATNLQTRLRTLFGSQITVTDNSNGSQLHLDVDLSSVLKTGSTALNLGDTAKELTLGVADTAQVNYTDNRVFRFSIDVDLTGLADSTTTISGDKVSADFGSAGSANGIGFNAEVSHTTSNPLTFGLQVGLIGMQTTPGGAAGGQGGYANNATMSLNISSLLHFQDNDQKLTVTELNAALPTFDVTFPAGQGNLSPTGLKVNETLLTMPFVVKNDATLPGGAANPGYIAGLSGVGGIIELRSFNVLDGHPALLGAGTDLNSSLFGRITASDILDMIDQTRDWAALFGESGVYSSQIPFLDSTLGSAYDFGTAFTKALSNQLSYSEQTLTGKDVPSLNQAGSFQIAIGSNAIQTISISAAEAATYQGLINNLNAKLNAAQSAMPASTRVQVRDTIQPSGAHVLEFFTTNAGAVDHSNPPDPIAFALANFVNPGLFGLPTVNQLTLLPAGQLSGTGASKYKLPEVAILTNVLNLAAFAGPVAFQLAITTAGVTTTKTITIEGRTYHGVDELAEQIQWKLFSAGVLGTEGADKVNVVYTDDGRLEFYATGADSISISYTNGTTGDPLQLGGSSKSVEASYLDFKVNGVTKRVYFNGNLTTGLVGAPAENLQNFVDALHDMLVASGIQDDVAGTGIDVQAMPPVNGASSDKIIFYARNPGTGTGKIASFSITGGTASLLTQLGFTQATPLDAYGMSVSGQSRHASFRTIQEFAERISTAGVVPGTGIVIKKANASFNNSNTGVDSKSFSFPLEFTLSNTNGLEDKTVNIKLDDAYGDLNGLESTSTANLSRVTTSTLTFGIKLNPTVAPLEAPQVAMAIATKGWNGQLVADGLISIALDNGIFVNLSFTQSETEANHDVDDFLDMLNDKLSHSTLAGKVAAEIIHDDDSGYDILVFKTNTASTDSRLLIVNAPAQLQSDSTIANAAIGTLGLNTNTTTSTGGAIIGSANFGTNVTLPSTNVMVLVSISDGSEGSINLAPFNYPTNATTMTLDEYIAALNLAIGRSPGLMKSDFSAQKIVAYKAPGTGGQFKIGFKINPDLVTDGTYSASTTFSFNLLDGTYAQPHDNGFADVDVGFTEVNVGQSPTPDLTVFSGHIADFTVPTANTLFGSFSVGGSTYAQVKLPQRTSTSRTAADLIADLNAAMATQDITFHLTGGATFTAKLGDYISARLYAGTDQIQLVLTQPSGKPIATSFRFDPSDFAVTNYGLGNPAANGVSQERFVHAMGAEAFLTGVELVGKAHATANNVATSGNLGYFGFTSANGTLDVQADTRAIVLANGTQSRFTLTELGIAAAEDTMGDIIQGGKLTTLGTSHAILRLNNFTFNKDSLTGQDMQGLNLAPKTGTAEVNFGTNFDITALPPSNEVYTGMLGFEKLSQLSLIDIFSGLLRSSEFVADVMALPGTAYELPLPFLNKLGLGDIINFGPTFQAAIIRALNTLSPTAQDLKKFLSQGLGIPAGDLDVAIATQFGLATLSVANQGSGYTNAAGVVVTISGGGGTGATATAVVDNGKIVGLNITNRGSGYTSPPTVTITGGNGTGATATATRSLVNASLDVTVDFTSDISDSTYDLPAYVDLNALGSGYWKGAPYVIQELAGLAAITATNPTLKQFNVDVTAASHLHLALGVRLVEDNAVTAKPTPFLYNTTTIDTLFNIGGHTYNVEIPIGTVKLELDNNGSIGVNATGESSARDMYGIEGIYNTDNMHSPVVLPDGSVQPGITTRDFNVRLVTNAPLSLQPTGAWVWNSPSKLVLNFVPSSEPGGVGTLLTSSTNVSLNDLRIQNITDLAVGQYLLINGQSDSPQNGLESAQNGLYQILDLGVSDTYDANGILVAVGHAFVLGRVKMSTAAGTPTMAQEVQALGELRVHVQDGIYAGRTFQQIDSNVSIINQHAILFAKQIDPGQYHMTMGNLPTYDLPVVAQVATTTYLPADYNLSDGTLAGKTNGSINAMVLGGVTGIDGYKDLQVGDYVLVWNQQLGPLGTATSYQNGIYQITDLGSATTKWSMQRPSWANTPAELTDLRVSVQNGQTYGRDPHDSTTMGTRFVQTQRSTLAVPISAGVSLTFSNDLRDVYKDTSTSVPTQWFTITADANVRAELPFLLNGVQISTDTGTVTGTVTAPLTISMTPKSYLGGPVRSGLDLFYDTHVVPFVTGTGSTATEFNKVDFPDLPHWDIPISNPLDMLKDPIAMADYLDLAFFNMQLAIDQATGNIFPLLGSGLSDYTSFIEDFRALLTDEVRSKINSNKDRPMTMIREAIFAILGNVGTGKGYLTSIEDVQVKVLNSSGTDLLWDFGGKTTDLDANETIAGGGGVNGTSYVIKDGKLREFVDANGTAASIEFSIHLSKQLADVTMSAVDLNNAVPGLGVNVGNATGKYDANGNLTNMTGGINVKRNFTLDLTFGMNPIDGFYLKKKAGGNDMVLKIEAALDGDVNTAGVQNFANVAEVGSWNTFTAKFVDMLDTPTKNHSGFFGDFKFSFNPGSGTTSDRIVLSDFQNKRPLGTVAKNGLMDYTLDADLDVHLAFTGRAPNVPGDVMGDLFISARYGNGFLAFASLPAGFTPTGEIISYNQLNPTNQATEDYDLPSWRYDRTQIADGAYKVALANLSIDAAAYLNDSVIVSLKRFVDGYKPVKPFVEFLASPLPGLSSIGMNIVPIDVIATQFGSQGGKSGAAGAMAFVALFKTFVAFARGAEATVNGSPGTYYQQKYLETWQRPRANLGTISNLGAIGSIPVGDWGKYRLANPPPLVGAVDGLLSRLSDAILPDRNPTPPAPAPSEAETRSRSNALSEALATPATPGRLQQAQNYISNKLDQAVALGRSVVDAGITAFGDKMKNHYDAKKQGQMSVNVGVSGGAFRYDMLFPENVSKLLLGQNANILFVETPRLEIAFAYARFFPIPPVPVVGVTVNINLNVFVQFNFGWDNKGFYYSSVNAAGVAAPVFGMTLRLAAGIELDVFLLQVGIQAFLQIDVNFYWNIGRLAIKTGASPNAIMGGQGVGKWTVNGGTTGQAGPGVSGETKLRGNQLDWLKANHPGDLFKVTITFTLGVTLYVDLNLLFTSTRIVEFTVAAQWNVLIPGFQPTALLGTYDSTNRILYLNMGYQNAQYNAEARLFADVSSINETFVITSRGLGSAGENVTITATLNGQVYTADYDNVMLVKGWAGHGTSTIDARALTSAIVNFYGGDGNSILYAGSGVLASYAPAVALAAAGTKNYLYGGLGISSLTGGASASELRGGRLNSTIVGGNANDVIYAGTGSDILVGSATGSKFIFDDGFKHTRIYATGSNNTVDMSRVDAAMRFNLGRILNSVTTGTSFAFFTPTFANRITNWIGGNRGDRVTISFFPPNGNTDPLTFTSGTGVNNYAVYLGNATANLVTNATANLGNINIVDRSGNRSAMVINTTRADPITFSNTEVTNGREHMTMSGLGSVILNAGDNVVLLGSTTNAWTNLGTNVVLNAGTFILVGNIEAENLTLSAVNSFAITKSINLRNNSDFHLSLVGRSTVDTANIFFGSLDGLSTPKITSSISNALGSTTMGDGSGRIYIDLPNGSMLNQSLVKKGIIQAANGTLYFRVRDNFGQEGNALELDIPRVAGKSTGDAGGIVIHSVRDLEIIQATTQDPSMWTSINGISTNNGVIDISMAAGKALNIGFLKVGGGKDIRIATDKLTIASGYYYYTTTYTPFSYTYNFGSFYGFPFSYTYSGVYTTVTRNGSAEVIQSDETGTSNLVFQNVTDGLEIQVGEVTNNASTLMITDAMLNAVQTGFASITVGRAKGYVDPITNLTTTTGKVTVGNYAHRQTLKVYGKEIVVRASTAIAALSSTRTLEFHAYQAPGSNGNITLTGGAGNASRSIRAASIFMFAEGDLTADRTLESWFSGAPAANGIVQLVAGDVTSGGNGFGSLRINKDVLSAGANNQVYLTAGQNDGDIVVADGSTVKATDLLTIRALGGAFTTGPNTQVQAERLDIQTLKGFDIEKGTFQEVTAEVTSTDPADSLIIRNTGALLVHKAQTGAGAITITTTGLDANLYIETVTAGINGDAAVTLSTTGLLRYASILTLPNAYNVFAGSLDATAAGDIDLRVNVQTLAAKSTVEGHVIIDTIGRPVTLDGVRTKDGLIQITATQIGQSIYAKNVVSETANSDNTISITTGPATGQGDITVGTIDAGTNSASPTYVTLISDGRVLKDLSGGLVTADNLLVQVFGSAIAPEPRVIDLNTRVNFLTVSNINAVGDYEINEAGSITLVDVKTFTGGNIKVTAVDDITAKVVQAVDATVTLDAGGSIINGGDPTDIILTKTLLAKAGHNIDVVTTVDTIDAESTIQGDIKIRETDGVLFRKIITNDGNMDLQSGFMNQTGQIVTVGNALIGIITAGTPGHRGDILLNAIGTATMDPLTPNALITGNKLTARTIGTMDLDIAVAELDAEAIDQGNITIREQGSLTKNRIVTYAGDIDLTATGSITSQLINAQGNAGNVTSIVKVNSDAGDIDFEGPVSAIVSVDVTADLGTITVRDAITVTNPNLQSPADFISLHGGRVDVTATGSLTTNTVESNINLTALTNGINVGGNIDSAGHLTLLAYGGDITLTGQLEASRDIVYNALAGKIAQTAGLTLTETLTADARDSIDLLTKVREMFAESHVSGNIYIKEIDDVFLRKVIAANGDIRIITGSPWNNGTLAVPGDAVVGIITAGAVGARRDIFITAQNGIFMDPTIIPHMITGRALKTQSVSFINIDTTVDSIESYIGGVGNATIRETDSLSAVWIETLGGGIDLRAGGSIVANELRTQGSGHGGDIMVTAIGGSIDLTGHAFIDGSVLFNAHGGISANFINTTSGVGARDVTLLARGGSIRVGQVGTGGYAGGNSAPSVGLITLESFAAITGFGGGIVAADTAVLRAQTGISNITLITRQANVTTNSGGIQMQSQTSHDNTLTDLSAGSGNVTVRQTGGGNLNVQRVNAARGNLNLSVGNGARLVLSQSFSGGSTTLQADQMSFPGGSSSLHGNGVLSLRPDSANSISFSGNEKAFNGFTSTDLANFGFDLVDITGVNGLGGLYFGLNPTQLAEQGILDYHADDVETNEDGSLTQLFTFHTSQYHHDDDSHSHGSTAVLSNVIERALHMTEVDYEFDESAFEPTAQQQQQAPEGAPASVPDAPLPAIVPPAAAKKSPQDDKQASRTVGAGSALSFATRFFQS